YRQTARAVDFRQHQHRLAAPDADDLAELQLDGRFARRPLQQPVDRPGGARDQYQRDERMFRPRHPAPSQGQTREPWRGCNVHSSSATSSSSSSSPSSSSLSSSSSSAAALADTAGASSYGGGISSLFTSTEVVNFRRSGATAANNSSSAPTTASTCSSGARVPHPGQRRTGSVCTSDTSRENDSSHFWH